MKSLFQNLLVLVALFMALTAHAETNSQNLFTALPGTAWEGTFRFYGESGTLRVAFLPEANGKGEIQYLSRAKFGGFIAPARLLLSAVDQPCAYTPRGFALETESSGQIRVYSCAKSSADEISLAQSATRSPLFNITVADTRLINEGKTLLITAVAGPMSLIKIEYELNAMDYPADVSGWIDQVK